MSSLARAWQAEEQFLESLRARYEDEGFTFTIAPNARDLPDFVGSYVPDALAQKQGLSVAIEVKRHNTSAAQRSLRDIRRLFEGHPDWRFDVAFMGTDPLQVTIPPAPPEVIRARVDEVRRLNTEGHHRAAFVMAWSLLEAALHSVDGEGMSKPRTPGTVVQTLAMNGYIEPETEGRIRSLIELRNRIVHGDVDVEPTSGDVETLLSAVSEALTAPAA